MIEKSLAELPKRKTDGATIIRSQDSGAMKAVVFKLNANPVAPVLVERYEVTLHDVKCHDGRGRSASFQVGWP